MKREIKILLLSIVLLLATTLRVNAADTTVSLNSSKTEAEKGDTFTVTINAKCNEGINGLSTTVSCDETKLELVKAEILDTTKWFNLGEDLKFDIIHYTTGTETSADLLKLTFKVKDTAQVGTKAKITVSNITLDSDAQSNSIKQLGTKETEISIIERLKININEYGQAAQGENKYIYKISPKMIAKIVLQKIQTNGIVEIFKDEIKITDMNNRLGTGMKIKISLNDEVVIYKSVITGDTNGDGDATFTDILQINKHRLNKASLIGEYLKAAEVTGDGKVDFMDILQINKYRLGKTTSL